MEIRNGKKIRVDLKQQAESKLKNSIMELTKTSFDCEAVYSDLLKSGFLEITPPEEDPPMISFLILDSLGNYRDGSSIKPGNIRLDIKNLIDTIPDVIVLGYSIALDLPILKICAAIKLWGALRDVLTIQISKEQAFLIVSLWKNCDFKHRISIENGLNAINALLEKYGEHSINEMKYNSLLDSLESIQCIEMENGVIWLREWISKKYLDKV